MNKMIDVEKCLDEIFCTSRLQGRELREEIASEFMAYAKAERFGEIDLNVWSQFLEETFN